MGNFFSIRWSRKNTEKLTDFCRSIVQFYRRSSHDKFTWAANRSIVSQVGHKGNYVNIKKAFAAAKAEPTFRGTLLKKSIKMK